MDYLAASGLEPQLAIPVIVVVVGALLVYVFGFQKSEEPSLEQLAVLQSTSSYKGRSVSNVKQKNVSLISKAKEKPVQNGIAGHDKDRATAKKKETTSNNKENKPPTTPKSSAVSVSKKGKQEVTRPEDFDSGDWIQAVSRKDKKKQVKKDDPKEVLSSPKKGSENKNKEKELKEAADDRPEESILKEAQVQVHSQTTQTTPKPSPEKKAKKPAKDVSTATSTPSSQESTPAKQKQPEQNENQVEKILPEVVNVNGVNESSKQSPEASPAKKQSISEDSPTPTEAKGHVAFDELGDTNVDAWEEAKSRGNKKRRARKD